MLLIHVVGIVVILVGLGLFVYDQVKARQGQPSQLSAWKINLSGPPALVLIVLGILVFVFPYTSFFGPPSAPVDTLPEIPTETTVTETTLDNGTTLPEESTTTTEVVFPDPPYDFQIYFDGEECGGDVIEWFQGEAVVGWYIIADVYSAATDDYVDSVEIDTNDGARFYEGRSALCHWEFYYADDVYYYIYIYSYNTEQYSEEPLIIEYHANSGQE